MNNPLKEKLEGLLSQYAAQKGVEAAFDVAFERPKDPSHGDLATNCAMKYAKLLGTNPRELATFLAEGAKGGDVVEATVAGPGFLNFRLGGNWADEVIARIKTEGDRFGSTDLGQGRNVQVEFVSANPTGPLHVGHGRGAAVGDVTANLLTFTGWDVQREYYVNDAGLQINILGASIQARYFELYGQSELCPFPEESYKGDYIYDVARVAQSEKGDSLLALPLEESLPYFKDLGCRVILEDIRQDLLTFGVKVDNFYSERSLYQRDLVKSAVDTLRQKGHIYEKEEATWFNSTSFGDDKDRVLFRSNGVPTYFASDVAYHKDKFDRGFDRVIDVWGCDHHGYIPRLTAAIGALGKDASQFNVLLYQFVNLLIDGKPVSMSTRAGTFETLADVVKEVGVDATRYNFLMRRSDVTVDFDMAEAKRQSSDNPVYYTQYAHARCCSLLSKAQENGVEAHFEAFKGDLMASEGEKKLVAKLADFPAEVARASQNLEPHRIVTYLYDLAALFHGFYNSCRILEEEPALRDHHLAVVLAVRQVLQNSLRLLGLSAPERM